MNNVYVLGALMPGGGNYMAYHLGCLLHRHFGYGLFEASPKKFPTPGYRYDIPIESISVDDMVRRLDKDDLMVINAAYSHYMFGIMSPGRKICYVQDFKTYSSLDCQLDCYVAVSSLVQRFLKAVYDIAAPVIPPFIDLEHMPEIKPWQERPADSALAYIKYPYFDHKLLLTNLQYMIKSAAPRINLAVLEGRDLSHQEFLRRIGEVRYFINLSLTEGFGLVPLEAMAMGTLVTGADGLAGRDYMRHQQNCLTSSVTNLRTLTDVVRRAFTDDAMAAQCAAQGPATARHYTYERFKAAWLEQFSKFLGRKPVNV